MQALGARPHSMSPADSSPTPHPMPNASTLSNLRLECSARTSKFARAYHASIAELSPDDLAIIARYPLNLDPVHRLLQETEHPCPDGTADEADPTDQSAIWRMLVTLIEQRAAFYLSSRTSSENIALELSRICTCVLAGDFHYDHYRPVIRLILQKAPDVDIWQAAISLVTTVSRATPLVSVPLTQHGTPVKSTSSSQRGSEQTRQLVEERLFNEIHDCTYKGVGGVLCKIF
ncbi:hypothetical protein AJ79_01694 [Helicocarpus griseus UAMH5409]|uniref:Uncharacterized protein n=1 Tax=Helicocarpus griseus UAMH5409 TaxID=1447875 RepID=A0A2B7Y6T0_9EURO|nr:hypothetical protein AJ79_01694 [Helicocarpus griseus UAMH5409]